MQKVRWSKNFAYAIGLIAADGYLSKDGRHISLVSKDVDQLKNFAKALRLNNKISLHSSGYNPKGRYYHIQFGNVKIYKFLILIGLSVHKTENIKALKIPDRYFAHFLRGFLDGDGSTYSYWDPRWKSSFQLYTVFISLSLTYLEWMQKKIELLLGLKGTIRKTRLRSNRYMYRLEYAKKNSIELIEYLYPVGQKIIFLKRKKFKIDQSLGIIRKQAEVVKLVYTQD